GYSRHSSKPARFTLVTCPVATSGDIRQQKHPCLEQIRGGAAIHQAFHEPKLVQLRRIAELLRSIAPNLLPISVGSRSRSFSCWIEQKSPSAGARQIPDECWPRNLLPYPAIWSGRGKAAVGPVPAAPAR